MKDDVPYHSQETIGINKNYPAIIGGTGIQEIIIEYFLRNESLLVLTGNCFMALKVQGPLKSS